jgi:hypothetical protein
MRPEIANCQIVNISMVETGMNTRGMLLVSIALIAAPATLRAQDDISTHFTIDDEDPERSVPDKAEALRRPLDMGYQLMLLSERAEAASARGDHLAAVKYWRAVAKAVPESALPFSKLCHEYAAAGDAKQALSRCRMALGLPGVTVDDNQLFVKLLLEQSEPLQPSDISDVTAISDHIEAQLKGEPGQLAANRMRCQLASRLGDVKRLTACTLQLQRLAPDDAQTLVFAWSLAIKQGKLEHAEQLLARAQAAKLPASALERMSTALSEAYARRPLWKRLLGSLPLMASMAVAMGLIALAARGFSRKRQRLGGI